MNDGIFRVTARRRENGEVLFEGEGGANVPEDLLLTVARRQAVVDGLLSPGDAALAVWTVERVERLKD